MEAAAASSEAAPASPSPASPMTHTPQAPACPAPRTKRAARKPTNRAGRPSALALEVRSQPATSETGSPEKSREDRWRPGAKAYNSQPGGESATSSAGSGAAGAARQGLAPQELMAQALGPLTATAAQPGSEGASTTASSTNEWELQGPEELERVGMLGQGQSGVVEKHRHKGTGKELGLKIINANGISEPQRKAIMLELRTFFRCKNPHIVDFYGFFFHENQFHIGLEYMDAGSLSSVLQKTRCVPENLLANITWQVLDGLEYLHCEMHVIHRDVKPSNLLLSSLGVVKITDFGVSGELEDELREESAGKVTWVGTIYYMSPERALGHKYRYDSDMWSLGLTLIECLNGRFPYLAPDETSFKQLNVWELIRRVVEQDAPRVPTGSNHSSEVQDFIQQMLQKEPRKRPSAAMMKTHTWLGHMPGSTPGGTPTPAQQAELARWVAQSGASAEVAEESARSPASAGQSDSPDKSASPNTLTSPSTLDIDGEQLGRSISGCNDLLGFASVSPVRSSEWSNLTAQHGPDSIRPVGQSASSSQSRVGGGGESPSQPAVLASGADTCDDPFAQYATGGASLLERPLRGTETSSSPWGVGLDIPQRGLSSEVMSTSPLDQSFRGGRGVNPFQQAAAAVAAAESPNAEQDRGAETPMVRSLRGGDNPFLMRSSSQGTPSPGLERSTSTSTAEGAEPIQRVLSSDSPSMSMSMRRGRGGNPFMQRTCSADSPVLPAHCSSGGETDAAADTPQMGQSFRRSNGNPFMLQEPVKPYPVEVSAGSAAARAVDAVGGNG